MARRHWTDQEIEALARESADCAVAMIGQRLRTGPDQQLIRWRPGIWGARVDISTLPDRLRDEGIIRRRDLFDLAGRAASSNSDRAVTALLIGVVAWGSGMGLRRAGVTDGDPRGPWRAQQALSQPSPAEAITRIRSALQITRRDGGSAAYSALCYGGPAKLAAMGESFFTKLIYACGYQSTATPLPRPLVLDTNVRKALVRHGGILRNEDWTLHHSPDAYRQYLLIAQTWAALWHVQPDWIEHALFEFGKSLP
jgi:hypothetical protein